MRANELKVGEHYRCSYHGIRMEMLRVGQGHGNVHRMRQLNPATSEPVLTDAGAEQIIMVSSRDILETTATFLRQRPEYLDNWRKQQKIADDRRKADEDRKSTLAFLKDVCEETAGLLTALGFECSVIDKPYDPKGDGFPYNIRISNPTENQDLLRRMVAEKWGISPHGQGKPVTGTEVPYGNTTEPEDQ